MIPQGLLNEYQLEKIKKRIKISFDKELNNKTKGKLEFSKKLKKELDLFVNNLYINGVIFFAFEINILFKQETEQELWELTHLKVEQFLDVFEEEIELVEFCYISINKLKDNSVFLKGVIGVRSIIGNNENLFTEIKKVFIDFVMGDCVVKKLKNVKSIKDWWNIVIVDNNFKFHRFVQYSKNFPEYYGRISDSELNFDEDGGNAFGLDESFRSKTSNISGVKMNNPSSKTIVIYLLNLFMWHKQLKIYKNKIYKEDKNGWNHIYDLNFFKFNNIKIVEELKSCYPQQLKEMNTIDFIDKNDWNSVIDDIESNNQYLPVLETKEIFFGYKNGDFLIKNA